MLSVNWVSRSTPEGDPAQKASSFRGAAEGREPGIQEHGNREDGFRVLRFAPPRNDGLLSKTAYCGTL
jgi:hypothetical protein